MKTRNRRITTFFLSLLIMLSCIPSVSNAEDVSPYSSGFSDSNMNSCFDKNALISDAGSVSSVLEPYNSSLSDPEALTIAESDYRERMERERADAFLAESKIADYINVNEFYETKPMFRVKAQESLNSYVFQNADGTKTVYLMAENVKYIDGRGDVREKDINLTVSSEGYAVNDSDIKLLLPKRLSDGIMLNTAFGSVTLTPQYHTDSAAKFDEKSNSVNYENAFGEGSFLRYVPTLSGLKEDIVLRTRPESNAFAFTVDAPEMMLETEDGLYYLVAPDNEEQRIRFDHMIQTDVLLRVE